MFRTVGGVIVLLLAAKGLKIIVDEQIELRRLARQALSS